MLSTVTTKGQITIPKEIRDSFDIHPQDKVDFIRESGRIILIPVKTLKDFRGSVTPKGSGNFDEERKKARATVGKRVIEEMK